VLSWAGIRIWQRFSGGRASSPERRIRACTLYKACNICAHVVPEQGFFIADGYKAQV
jgi:hypothetical protein